MGTGRRGDSPVTGRVRRSTDRREARPDSGPSGYGVAGYGVAGYAYTPPRRRRSGGGVLAVGVLGFFALLGIGGAMFVKATSRTVSTPISSPIAAPPGKKGNTGSKAAAADRLYQIGSLPATGCRGLPIRQGDPRSFRLFLDATTDCLDNAWRQGFGQAGMRFSAPQRVFWSTPGRSPCGEYPSPGVAAFYCPVNASMYIGVTDAQRAAGGLPVRYNVAYAREIAHEYGHAIQDLSGILDYSHEARASAPTLLQRNTVTKRSELQAQCLSGVFMSSVRGSFPIAPGQWGIALRDSYGRGDNGRPLDERDHGTNAHYRGWLQVGYLRGTTSACNTWAASPPKVS